MAEAARSLNSSLGMDLLDVPAVEPIPGGRAISRAITELCKVQRSKLAVATKASCITAPGLIPIFDSVVEGHYKPRCPTVRGRTWGEYAIALSQLAHTDLLGVADELRDLRDMLRENGTPLAGPRILNVLIWSVGSGKEASLRRLAA